MESELDRLIKEQALDRKWGRRAWPEFRDTVSLDAMHAIDIDIDQDGELVRRGVNRFRNGAKRTSIKGRGSRPRKVCQVHPGEMMTTVKRNYCRGCQREYERRRMGYVTVKRRKIDGPRTKADIASTKKKYRASHQHPATEGG